MVETYNKTVNVEGQLMVLMANRYILPAALQYQTQVAQSVSAVKAAGAKSVEGKKLLDALTKLVDQLKQRSDKLAHALEHEATATPRSTRALPGRRHTRDDRAAGTGDAIEITMPHELWPLATYREMLFIK